MFLKTGGGLGGALLLLLGILQDLCGGPFFGQSAPSDDSARWATHVGRGGVLIGDRRGRRLWPEARDVLQ
jgi:hypothetical protein